MANIRIIRSFTKSERERLYLIQSLYKQCIDTELPRELTLEKKKPIHKAQRRDWVTETWVSQMGKGVLRPSCESIVYIICDYELERSNRFMGSGYRDDPFVLFLEEFKSWVSRSLSLYECSTDNRAIVIKRIRYLEYVMAEPNLFDPFPTHKMTMQQVLFHCRKILKSEVVPTMDAEIAQHAAREDFKNLENSIFSVLDYCVKFVFNIFRDGKLSPTNIVISELRHPSRDKFRGILKTSTGVILHELLTSKLFYIVFRDDEVGEEVSENKELKLTKVEDDVNPFIDEYGNAIVPECLRNLESSYRRPYITLENCFDSNSSGMDHGFRNNEKVSKTFIKFHGLLYEMGRFLCVCKQARSLASLGGDLLTYGLANQQVRVMIDNYDVLMRELRNGMEYMYQVADRQFESLVNQNKARPAANPWIKHFKKISRIVEKLRADMSVTDNLAAHVRTEAVSLTLSSRWQMAKQETINFVGYAESYARYLSGVLNIEYKPSRMPELSPSLRLIADTMHMDENIAIIDGHDDEGRRLLEGLPGGRGMAIEAPSDQERRLSEPALEWSSDSEAFLDMSNRNVSDMSISSVLIRVRPETREIDLQRNNLSAQGLFALLEHCYKYCTCLKSLILYSNCLGAEGARALAIALTHPGCRLEKLDLNANDIGDDGILFICQGLRANETLTYLDLAYNQITDVGMEEMIDVLEQGGGSSLRHLKLSGNLFTDKCMNPLFEILCKMPRLVDVDVSDNDLLSESLVQKIRDLCYPRKIAFAEEENRMLMEEEQLKMRPSPALPIKGTSDRAAIGPTPEMPIVEMVKNSKVDALVPVRRNLSPDASSLSDSEQGKRGVVVQEDIEDSEENMVMTEQDFYPMIRVLQILSTRPKEEGGWVKKKLVNRVFSGAVYSVSIPNLTQAFDEYLDAAREGGILELKMTKNASVLVRLTRPWVHFSVPVPDNLKAEVPQNGWDLFIGCCYKSSIGHRKTKTLILWMKKTNPAFQNYSEAVMALILDTAIYSGVLVLNTLGKYKSNLSQKTFPIDTRSCPKIHFEHQKEGGLLGLK